MTTPPAELPTDLETAHQLIRELLASLRQQTVLNEHLQHQLETLLRRTYGPRAEKLDPNQLLLFAREIVEATAADPATTPPPSTDAQPAESVAPPKKNGHGRKPLPKGLERRARSTTSHPNSSCVPTAVLSAPASARRSASSSSLCRPA